jgi:uncharacterized protein YmfQ (DUF2313 family)
MAAIFDTLQQPDFQRGLQGVLPRGRAWPRDPGSTLAALLNGHADAVYGVHQRFVQLLDVESDPSQTIELLTDWENDYGLPDPCTPLNATLQQRHAALLAKIAAQGGQSIAYYESVASVMGFAITITELHPFRTQVSSTGDELNGIDAAFTWIVNTASVHVIAFTTGVSATGENLRTVDNTSLECRLNALKPAHTVLLFNYT